VAVFKTEQMIDNGEASKRINRANKPRSTYKEDLAVRSELATIDRGKLAPINVGFRPFASHFSNDDFPVYPLMYRAFRTMPQRQKLFVYVRCARFNGQSLAEAMFGELDRCPPKAKATRSNRVGCAISSNKSM
jgi:hypothetical protein